MPYPTAWDEYEQLHERLANIGLYKQIVGDDGASYDLPDAEYYGFVPLGYTELRDLVSAITCGIRPGAKVLVTQTVRSAWILPKVA